MLSALIHLFYPHCCESCGRDLAPSEEVLCLRCHLRLPATRFHLLPENPVEKLFWGRMPVEHAAAAYFFGKHSRLQHLIHAFKYQERRDIALFLGRQMGLMLKESRWLNDIHIVVPVPLFKTRERKRGYNQAGLLGEGICGVTGFPLVKDALVRSTFTETQTHKGRGDRWENVGKVFSAHALERLHGRHVLLVDDVLTTGATMEACARRLLEGEGVKVSVFCLAYTNL